MCFKTYSVTMFFFFQAEDGIRDFHVTGVQTCALPIFCDVENPDTRCELIGQSASMPVALAPLGMAGLYARRGEAQAARAAAAFGVPFSLSTVGICSLAEVQVASGKNSWFQLYMLRDSEAVEV